MKELKIPARDGYELAATLFEASESRQIVLLNSATPVSRQFYRHFAQFLCEQGYTVLIYDYRGIGESAPASLKGFAARMRDWALLDMAGVVDWLSAKYAPDKLIAMGHSAGG
ncbi:MAG: alpha/beta fold hydrolase, partial [Chloroflexota bacterium]